jgi:hypothetical protein
MSNHNTPESNSDEIREAFEKEYPVSSDHKYNTKLDCYKFRWDSGDLEYLAEYNGLWEGYKSALKSQQALIDEAKEVLAVFGIKESHDIKSGIIKLRNRLRHDKDKKVFPLEDIINEAVELLTLMSGWKDAYPEDVFPPIGNDTFRVMCMAAGMTVDRVSAHVLRAAVKGWCEAADNFLTKIEKDSK